MNTDPAQDWTLREKATKTTQEISERITGHLQRMSGSIVSLSLRSLVTRSVYNSSASSPSAAFQILSADSWQDARTMKCSWNNCSPLAERTRLNKSLQVFSLRPSQPLPHIPRQLLMLSTSFWRSSDQKLEEKSQHLRVCARLNPKLRFLNTCTKRSVSTCIFTSNKSALTNFFTTGLDPPVCLWHFLRSFSLLLTYSRSLRLSEQPRRTHDLVW